MADTSSTASPRQYEIMFIVAGDKPDNQVTEIKTAVNGEITTRGGQITKEDSWGLRNFTYPIRRQETGYYTVLNFELSPSKLSDLNKHLRLNTNILRFLILALPEDYKFLTYAELREHGKVEKKPGRRSEVSQHHARQETDAIRTEGATLKKRDTVAAPTPTVAKESVAPVSKPTAAAPVEKPVTPMAQKPKAAPKAAPVSEEERLKQLDKELEALIKDEL